MTTVTAAMPVLPQLPLRPLEVSTVRMPLAFAAEETDADAGTWISAAVEGETTIAGLTWEDGDAPDEAEVRVRVDGAWTEWDDLHVDDEHTPDPGTSEDERGRGGTAPIVVEGADAVQFRVASDQPPGAITAELVDVDDPDAGRRGRARAGAAEASPSAPAIHTRAEWGGDACVTRDPEDIDYADRVEVLFVHHTTGHTSYEQADVAAIVRGICSYHVTGRGWDDIGYNALIDRYGGVWEGRAGGITKGVIGAHTGGFNSFSTGVALIGDHESGGAPTQEAQDALVGYAAWKLDVHNVDPVGTAVLTSKGSSRWSEGTQVSFNAISGHRDASATSCPGSSCYVLLPTFRSRVGTFDDLRIFGSWADRPLYEMTDDGWGPVTFSFELSQPSSWVLQVIDPSGRIVHETSGQGSDGTVVWATRSGGRDAAKGPYTSRLRATRLSDGAAATPAVHGFLLGGELGEFDDVADGSMFRNDIVWLAEARITVGCNPPTNTRFCPGDDVTRGQMAAFLSRALDLPAGPAGRFTDVPADHTFADAIARLAEAGITRGCNPPHNTQFCPGAKVTRAEMAAFLARAYRLSATSHPGFADVGPTYWAEDSIRRLAGAGITRGCNPPDNSRYCPEANVTREQMAAFLHRASTT